VIFDDRTTIGMVRLYAKETAVELKVDGLLMDKPRGTDQ
jgi:hypothetical protein